MRRRWREHVVRDGEVKRHTRTWNFKSWWYEKQGHCYVCRYAMAGSVLGSKDLWHLIVCLDCLNLLE